MTYLLKISQVLIYNLKIPLQYYPNCENSHIGKIYEDNSNII